MAASDESVCLSNPNFAVICSFLDRYGDSLGLPTVGYKDLQEWIEATTFSMYACRVFAGSGVFHCSLAKHRQ